MTRSDDLRTAAHLRIYELSSRSVLLLLRLPGLPSAADPALQDLAPARPSRRAPPPQLLRCHRGRRGEHRRVRGPGPARLPPHAASLCRTPPGVGRALASARVHGRRGRAVARAGPGHPDAAHARRYLVQPSSPLAPGASSPGRSTRFASTSWRFRVAASWSSWTFRARSPRLSRGWAICGVAAPASCSRSATATGGPTSRLRALLAERRFFEAATFNELETEAGIVEADKLWLRRR